MLYLVTGIIDPTDGEMEIAKFVAAGDAYAFFDFYKQRRPRFRQLCVYKLDKRGKRVERLYLYHNDSPLVIQTLRPEATSA